MEYPRDIRKLTVAYRWLLVKVQLYCCSISDHEMPSALPRGECCRMFQGLKSSFGISHDGKIQKGPQGKLKVLNQKNMTRENVISEKRW